MMETEFRCSKNGKSYTEDQIVAHGQKQLAEGKTLGEVSKLIMDNFGFNFEIRDRILGKLDKPSKAVGCPQPIEVPPSPAQNMDDAIIAMNSQLDAEMVINPDKVDQMERWIKVRMSDRALAIINDSLSAAKLRKLHYQDFSIVAVLHEDSVRNNPGGASPRTRFVEFSKSENLWIKPLNLLHTKKILAVLEVMGLTTKVADHKRGQAGTWKMNDTRDPEYKC